eukprot:TRINITY_DN2889_c0_g1_i3.p1 TRINITY_DN2889_c0_g1~~TRINITY_DN2889_c0_g1_i3.p1  ORF type:complete len:157 (+),score=24.80 TRINITY_DN2889_c0_g1_i3:75-545(+)
MSLQQSILPQLPESALQPLRRSTPPTKVIPPHPSYRTTYQVTHGSSVHPITYQSSLADTIQSARMMQETLIENELSRSGPMSMSMSMSMSGERPGTNGHHRSGRINREFFEGGHVSVSTNGDAAAQCYFHKVRPLEGSPHVHYPSKTHLLGHPFYG